MREGTVADVFREHAGHDAERRSGLMVALLTGVADDWDGSVRGPAATLLRWTRLSASGWGDQLDQFERLARALAIAKQEAQSSCSASANITRMSLGPRS